VLTGIAEKSEPCCFSRKRLVTGAVGCHPLSVNSADFLDIRPFRNRIDIGRSNSREDEDDDSEKSSARQDDKYNCRSRTPQV